MTQILHWILKFSRVGAIFFIYSFYTVIGLEILRASYFWKYGIVPLNNGTYVWHEYDPIIGRDAYNLYRMSDSKRIAWDVEFVCFSDSAVHANVGSQKRVPSGGEFVRNLEADIIYIDGEYFSPKNDLHYERLRKQAGIIGERRECLGFCHRWLPVSYLIDFRDRFLLETICGPLPRWLSRFHERPRL